MKTLEQLLHYSTPCEETGSANQQKWHQTAQYKRVPALLRAAHNFAPPKQPHPAAQHQANMQIQDHISQCSINLEMEDDSPLEMCHSQSQTHRWGDAFFDFMDALEILDGLGAMKKQCNSIESSKNTPYIPLSHLISWLINVNN